MQPPDNDYIRFSCSHNYTEACQPVSGFQELLQVRLRLIELGLLGMHPDGTGFGNVSIRLDKNDRFLISGTATGDVQAAGPEHFAIVESADPDNNTVHSRGPVRPSSECMSHQALYAGDAGRGSVLHVHSEELWKALQKHHPSTPEAAAYGTPELARAIQKAAGQNREGLIILQGHFPGLMVFGSGPEATLKLLYTQFNF